MMASAKLLKKGLKVAHINICSLRNKLIHISNLLSESNIHVLAISETHLESIFENSALSIQGYNIYVKDINANGGGVAIYIQNHTPVKVRVNRDRTTTSSNTYPPFKTIISGLLL